MALFVICLVIIDMIILVTYTVTEAVRDRIGVRLTSNRELPEEIIGVSTLFNPKPFFLAHFIYYMFQEFSIQLF